MPVMEEETQGKMLSVFSRVRCKIVKSHGSRRFIKKINFAPHDPPNDNIWRKITFFAPGGLFLLRTSCGSRLCGNYLLRISHPALENAKYKIIQEGTNLTNPIPTCKIQRMAKYHKDKFKLMISVQIQIYKYKVEHWQKHSLQNQIMLIVGSHHVFF